MAPTAADPQRPSFDQAYHDCMGTFMRCDHEAERLGVPLTAIPLMGEIARYNQTDCRVMAQTETLPYDQSVVGGQ